MNVIGEALKKYNISSFTSKIINFTLKKKMRNLQINIYHGTIQLYGEIIK